MGAAGESWLSLCWHSETGLVSVPIYPASHTYSDGSMSYRVLCVSSHHGVDGGQSSVVSPAADPTLFALPHPPERAGQQPLLMNLCPSSCPLPQPFHQSWVQEEAFEGARGP